MAETLDVIPGRLSKKQASKVTCCRWEDDNPETLEYSGSGKDLSQIRSGGRLESRNSRTSRREHSKREMDSCLQREPGKRGRRVQRRLYGRSFQRKTKRDLSV